MKKNCEKCSNDYNCPAREAITQRVDVDNPASVCNHFDGVLKYKIIAVFIVGLCAVGASLMCYFFWSGIFSLLK